MNNKKTNEADKITEKEDAAVAANISSAEASAAGSDKKYKKPAQSGIETAALSESSKTDLNVSGSSAGKNTVSEAEAAEKSGDTEDNERKGKKLSNRESASSEQINKKSSADVTSDPKQPAQNKSAGKSTRQKNYSTAFTLYRTKIYTSDVIKYFQKKTFSVINNCLFNLCMVRPIHMDDSEYDELYKNLCMIFENTEKQLGSAQEKFLALFGEYKNRAPDIYYSAPLETELQLKTPLSLRYVKILESLDHLLQIIDKAHNAGFIVNPRDAVKLKFQWTRQIFMFTGEIRELDNGGGMSKKDSTPDGTMPPV